MADRNTDIDSNDNLLESFFERTAIKTLNETVAFYRIARKYPLPARSGKTMTFNGFRRLAAPSSNLDTASSNAAVTLSSRKVTASILSYGRVIKVTDLAELVSIISPMDGALGELTQCAALTLDNAAQLAIFKNLSGTGVLLQVGQQADVKAKLLSAWLAAQTSSFCANTGPNTGGMNGGSAIARTRQFGLPVVFGCSTTRLSAGTATTVSARPGPIGVRKAVTRLKRLAAPKFASGTYVGVVHPYWTAGVFGNPDYKSYLQTSFEGPRETMFKDKVSMIHGVEFVESQNMPVYASSAMSCAPAVIMGEGCLAITELGGGVEFLVKRPGPQSTNDPFNLNNTVSFKVRAAAAILNPSCGVILLNHTPIA